MIDEKQNADHRKNLNKVGVEYNDYCIISGNPKIGKDTWIGYFTIIDGTGGLEIGEHCTIASGVHIYTHDAIRWAIENLDKDLEKRKHLDHAPVKIGNNVFIGANSVIVKGVTIGNNVVIGMNATILHDVEIGDNSIIAAGCVVKEKMKIPDNSFVTGVPGEIKGKVTAEQLWWSQNSPSIYQELAQRCKREGLEGRKP